MPTGWARAAPDGSGFAKLLQHLTPAPDEANSTPRAVRVNCLGGEVRYIDAESQMQSTNKLARPHTRHVRSPRRTDDVQELVFISPKPIKVPSLEQGDQDQIGVIAESPAPPLRTDGVAFGIGSPARARPTRTTTIDQARTVRHVRRHCVRPRIASSGACLTEPFPLRTQLHHRISHVVSRSREARSRHSRTASSSRTVGPSRTASGMAAHCTRT